MSFHFGSLFAKATTSAGAASSKRLRGAGQRMESEIQKFISPLCTLHQHRTNFTWKTDGVVYAWKARLCGHRSEASVRSSAFVARGDGA